MSDEKDESPSAEELLDDMSEGEEENADGDGGMSDDTMDELGGLFGVSSSGSAASENDGASGESTSGEEHEEGEDSEAESADEEDSSAEGARFDPETASKEVDAIEEKDAEGGASESAPIGIGEEDTPVEAADESSDAQTVQMSADAAEAIAQSGEFDAVEQGEFREKLLEMAEDAGDAELAEQIASLGGDAGARDEKGGGEATGGEGDSVPPPEALEEGPPEADEAATPDAADDAAVGGVFAPSGGDEASAGAGAPDDSYLDEDDLGEYSDGESSGSRVFLIGGGIVLLLAGIVVALFAFTSQGKRLAYLLKGDLKEYEYQQKQQHEDKLREKQREIIDDAPKIGTLRMSGFPSHALIEVDGEGLYAQTPESKHWREIRLQADTQFPIFEIDGEHTVTVSSPGFEPKDWKLTLGMWDPVEASVPDLEDAALKYNKKLDVTLDPKSPGHLTEFEKRMEKNPDDDYYGEVMISSKPKGAKIIFNNKPLLDEEGEELETPVSFEKRYFEDEETGKIEEEKIKVDTAQHHKVVLKMPEEKGEYPTYVSPIKRQMWSCSWKDDEEPEEASPEECDYTFELNVDFDQLKSFAERREKDRKKIKKAWAEARDKVNSLATDDEDEESESQGLEAEIE